MSSSSPVTSLLSIYIEHRLGPLALRFDLQLIQPWTVLFGPSGSGKSTLLRAIAGFVKPDSGHIRHGSQTLFDSTTGIFVPAHLRAVRSAAQSARLFPHLSVLENVLYGSGWASKPADAQHLAQQLMALFRIQNLAQRMPRELSGGERERVSAARAILSATTFAGPGHPLLLLDEPFTGLDTPVRDHLLLGLKLWVAQWKLPVLSVTHDIGEAFQLEADVVKIAAGQVQAQGPAALVLAEERQRLLAQLQS